MKSKYEEETKILFNILEKNLIKYLEELKKKGFEDEMLARIAFSAISHMMKKILVVCEHPYKVLDSLVIDFNNAITDEVNNRDLK